MIEVTLMLIGGHSRTFSLDERDPTLSDLVRSVAGGSADERGQRLYNIVTSEEGCSFIFSSASVVALITNPQLELVLQNIDQASSSSKQSQDYHLLQNFLGNEECTRLFTAVETRYADFTASKVEGGANPSLRSSKVLYNLGHVGDLLIRKISYELPMVFHSLGLPPQRTVEIESQITAHHNLDFYGRHMDLVPPDRLGDASQRVVTFVYYFYREPRLFTGGQLRLSSYRPDGVNDGTIFVIEPMNDSIIFFRSSLYHEILPVVCESESFRDGRFTLNGWIRCS